MARMSIDDSALRDPRVLRLAKRLGLSRRETIGTLLDVWAIAYDRQTEVLPQEDVDSAAEIENFSCDMIVVGLAVSCRGGVRISGAQQRVEYLKSRREAGKIGGLKSGESRRDSSKHSFKLSFADREAPAKHSLKHIEARGNPPDPVPDLPPDPVPDPDNREGDAAAPIAVPLALAVPEPEIAAQPHRPKRAPAKTHPDQQLVIDGFHERYKARYGTKPTWDVRSIGQIGTLLKKHTSATLFERMEFMFRKPGWPEGARSLDTFVRHIDAWVDATRAAESRHIPEL